jgi:hypothetical protein
LLLEAVAQRHNSLDQLCKLFAVHRRVIIEGLVTLMQAGWIALTSANEFAITGAGKIAIAKAKSFPPNMLVSKKTDYVVMERVGGQIAHTGSVSFQDKRALRRIWQIALRLHASDIPVVLDPGAVSPFLYRDSGEWIRWIVDISPIRRGADFIVTSADPEKHVVTGLPREWEDLLSEEILDRVRHASRPVNVLTEVQQKDFDAFLSASATFPRARQICDKWTVRQEELEFCAIKTDPLTRLRELLSVCRDHVAVVFNELDPAVCTSAIDLFNEFIAKGISVDLVYAGAERPSCGAQKSIDDIRKNEHRYAGLARNAGKFTLTFIEAAPLNVILLNTESGYRAVICSHSLLGSAKEPLWLAMTNQGVVADLCQVLADACSKIGNPVTSPLVSRLRTAAGTCTPTVTDGNNTSHSSIELLEDSQHAAAFREMLADATESLQIVVSHVPESARSLLTVLGRTVEQRSISIALSAATAANSIQGDLVERFKKIGGTLRATSNVPITLLCRDGEEVVLGNYNWMIPFSLRSNEPQRGLGVRIRGRELVSFVLRSYGLADGDHNETADGVVANS